METTYNLDYDILELLQYFSAGPNRHKYNEACKRLGIIVASGVAERFHLRKLGKIRNISN